MRPADAIARAVKVMRILTGEERAGGLRERTPPRTEPPPNSAARAGKSAPKPGPRGPYRKKGI